MTPGSPDLLRHGAKTRFSAAGSRQRHVVMVMPTYLPESFGGAEQQCRKLAHALLRSQWRVTVLAPRLRADTPEHEILGDFAVKRFRATHAPNLGGRHFLSSLRWTFCVVLWMWVNRSRFDVIHAFHGRLHAIPAVVGAALLNKPCLIKIGRGGEHFDLRVVQSKRVIGSLACRLMRHASGYVANSSQIEQDLVCHGVDRGKIFRIPNGVEVPAEHPRDQRPAGRFIYLGRLDPEKRIDVLLRGFAALPANPRATLTIVGDGTCRGSLSRLCSQLRLGERVVFAGSTDDVGRFLCRADFFVSTSSSEGMSNALLEAMSHGVVPVVSKVSGVEDIVADGANGFVFEPDDFPAFLNALERARSLDGGHYRSLSKAAHETIRTSFSIESIACRHIELYEALCRSSAAAST